MPKTASSRAVRDIDQGKSGFLFVTTTGILPFHDNGKVRRNVRSHVMRNFLDSNKSAKNDIQLSVKPLQQNGKRFRFRLKPGELEIVVPQRDRHHSPATRSQKRSPEAEVGKLSRRSVRAFTVVLPESRPRSEFNPDSKSRQSTKHSTAQSIPVEASLEDLLLHNSENDLGWDDWDLQAYDGDFKSLPDAPLNRFDTSCIDPLKSLPVYLSPTDELLIDHLNNFESHFWCPTNGQGPWFRQALQDPRLFHATIYNRAMHFANAYPGFIERNPEVIQHKIKAIHMINSALSNPELSTTDSNIGAVVAIVAAEIAHGSVEEASRHMAGLHAMVAARGGLDLIGDGIGGMLQRQIRWTDLICAELFSQPLRFTKHEYQWDEVRNQSNAVYDDVQHALTDEPQISRSMQAQVMPLLLDIRHDCEEFAERPLSVLTEAEKVYRADRYHSIERRLRQAAEPHEYTWMFGQEDQETIVWRACAMAGLLYVQHMLRGLPLGYLAFGTVCRDLMTVLLKIEDRRRAWQSEPELLLWVLSIGTQISESRPQHTWFAKTLAEACDIFGITSWKTYRKAMRGVLWVENVDESRYAWIWQESAIYLKEPPNPFDF